MSVVPASVLAHNATLLNDLEEGDLIEFPRGAYSHWATYIGEGEVVHLAGDDGDGLNITSGNFFTICGKRFNKAKVVRDDFFKVADKSKARKNNGKDRKLKPSDKEMIVDRALSRLGEIGYNILWKNCEHFASWCRYGEEWSEQATSFLTWASIATLVVGGIALISGSRKREGRRMESQ